jgi:hypothetical protein
MKNGRTWLSGFPESQERTLQQGTPENKKTLHRCKVLIIRVENIGIARDSYRGHDLLTASEFVNSSYRLNIIYIVNV